MQQVYIKILSFKIKFHISSTTDLMKQVSVLEEYSGNFIEHLAVSSTC